jgi:predicted enzyme related to lactoylglutathione lyase
MVMEVLFAGVRVRDLQAAVEWYSRLFGRDPDMVPNEQEVMWRVAEGGWLYVVQAAELAGMSIVSICVDDLDRFLADLAGRNLKVGPVEAVGDAGRRAKAQDPDGNSIDVIQVAR